MGFVIALWTPLVATAGASMCTEPTLERLADTTVADAAPPPTDGEVPWCANSDDPHCAPLPARPEPTRVEGRTPVNAVSHAATSDDWPCGSARPSSAQGLSHAAGVTHRLERPPRPAGRVFR
jgi:hypothetical protein